MQPHVDAPDAGNPPSDGTDATSRPGEASPARPAADPLAGLEDPHARSATIICVANQKGGVGKTTTTVSLGAALAGEGAQVLVVDLDPQGNATTGLGLRVQEGGPSTYRVLVEGMDVEDAAEPTAVRGLHVLPSSLDLAGAEIELVPAFSREGRLKSALEAVRDLYDVVLIDCPPSLGLLTINAFVAADQVLVPIQCEYYALEGLGQLMRTMKLVGDSLNRELELGGVVLTMYDARTNLSQQVVDEVREFFGDRAYHTIIPRTVRLSEAPSYGQPITVFDSSSRGSRAYRRLAREVARRLGLELEEEELSPLDRLLGTTDAPAGAAGPGMGGLPTDLSREDVLASGDEVLAEEGPGDEQSEHQELQEPTVRVRSDMVARGPVGGADAPVDESTETLPTDASAHDRPVTASTDAQPAPTMAPDGPAWVEEGGDEDEPDHTTVHAEHTTLGADEPDHARLPEDEPDRAGATAAHEGPAEAPPETAQETAQEPISERQSDPVTSDHLETRPAPTMAPDGPTWVDAGDDEVGDEGGPDHARPDADELEHVGATTAHEAPAGARQESPQEPISERQSAPVASDDVETPDTFDGRVSAPHDASSQVDDPGHPQRDRSPTSDAHRGASATVAPGGAERPADDHGDRAPRPTDEGRDEGNAPTPEGDGDEHRGSAQDDAATDTDDRAEPHEQAPDQGWTRPWEEQG